MKWPENPGASSILALTIVISLIGLFSRKFLERTVLRPYTLVRSGGYATLVTSGFVHAGFGHLIFNLITFYSFAFPLERAIGTTKFVVLYFTGMVLSGLGTCRK